MASHRTFTTSQLAEAAACGSQTLRYYERRGLLPEPPRTAGGHRIYGPEHLARLLFIQRVQRLGFALDEIQELLKAEEDARTGLPDARSTLDRFVDKIDEKVAALGGMRAELELLRNVATGGIAEVVHGPPLDLSDTRIAG